jgi:hypothetical protein
LQCLPTKKINFKKLPPAIENFFSIHNWMKKNLPSEGIVISRKPTVTYFFTNHQAICYQYTPDPKKIWNEILRYNIKYMLVDEIFAETYYYLSPFLFRYKKNLKLLHRIGNTAIFEIKTPIVKNLK